MELQQEDLTTSLSVRRSSAFLDKCITHMDLCVSKVMQCGTVQAFLHIADGQPLTHCVAMQRASVTVASAARASRTLSLYVPLADSVAQVKVTPASNHDFALCSAHSGMSTGD